MLNFLPKYIYYSLVEYTLGKNRTSTGHKSTSDWPKIPVLKK